MRPDPGESSKPPILFAESARGRTETEDESGRRGETADRMGAAHLSAYGAIGGRAHVGAVDVRSQSQSRDIGQIVVVLRYRSVRLTRRMCAGGARNTFLSSLLIA